MAFELRAGSTEMDLLGSAAAGMSTQRTLLDIAARNVGAAQAATPEHPYSRLVAQLSADPQSGTDASFDPEAGDDETPDSRGPAIAGVRTEPGAGDALSEMIAVLDAQRAYEQNASVFDTAKRLAERTIDIGRS